MTTMKTLILLLIASASFAQTRVPIGAPDNTKSEPLAVNQLRMDGAYVYPGIECGFAHNPLNLGMYDDSNHVWFQKGDTMLGAPTPFVVTPYGLWYSDKPNTDSFAISIRITGQTTVAFVATNDSSSPNPIRFIKGPCYWHREFVKIDRRWRFVGFEIPYWTEDLQSPNAPNVKVYVGQAWAFTHTLDTTIHDTTIVHDTIVHDTVRDTVHASVPVEKKPFEKPTEFIDVLGRPCPPSDIYRRLPDGRGLVP